MRPKVKQTEENTFYSKEELAKEYVYEKMQLVHYELILDELYMSRTKDSDWKEKQMNAERLYEETREKVEFLSLLWEKELRDESSFKK